MIDRRGMVAGLAGAALLAAGRAVAGPVASPWSRGAYSAIRLVAGGRRTAQGAALLAAGLEFELKPGFHTYWREPGESGVPPMFDWSASQNLAGVEVLWPAPRRFNDANGFFIGYETGLLLPLHVVPKDETQPVRLVLKLDYAVCDKICVPAAGEAALALAPVEGVTTRFAGAIQAAEARVPLRLRMGEARDGLSVDTAAIRPGGHAALLVDARVPPDATPVDLFVEGPTGSMFGRPHLSQAAGAGALRCEVPLTMRPKHAGRARLRLTLTAGERAVETETDLDLPGKKA